MMTTIHSVTNAESPLRFRGSGMKESVENHEEVSSTSTTDCGSPIKGEKQEQPQTQSPTGYYLSSFVPKPSKVYTMAEIEKHNSDDSSWVVYDGKIYDITSYIKSGIHPGGNSVLQDYVGSDLTEAFDDIGHSASATHLLESFFMGYLEGSGKLENDVLCNGYAVPPVHQDRDYKIGRVDFRKPLVSQIYSLTKQEYVDLSLEFFCSTAICDFFASPYLEVFSRTAWWVVPSVWLPVATLIFTTTMSTFGISYLSALFFWMVGIIVWSFAEYCIHRFLFHFNEEKIPDYNYARVIHFLCHGVHHVLPFDQARLVMPPALLIILMTPFYLLASSLLPQWFVRAIWSGVLTGYVLYDLIHYASHHFPIERIPLLNFMKAYHMKHHFKEPLLAFGVSTPFWDYVFGTQL